MSTPKTGNNAFVLTARVLPWMAVLVAALALALASSASAAPRITTSSRPLISDNITPVFTVPGVHPIGARIRGNYMYVTGPEGLTVFDISDPEMPLPAGALPLPHFENEDVDLGGNTLLISNDPSEGVGILYVIDISNPASPKLASATPNGFIDFAQSEFGADSVVPPGVGHTASCIPGAKSACQYAYLAGTSKGIAIVDLTDPTKPVFAKEFKPDITGFATHDVQIDGTGLAWIVGYQGSQAFDVSDPLNPRPVLRTDPAVQNTGVAQPGVIPPSANPLPGQTVTEPITGIPLVGGDGASPIDFIHHDSLRFGPLPKPKKGQQLTYPAGGKGDVVGIVEEDYARPTCEGAGSFQTWKIGDDGILRLQDQWATEIQALSSGSGFAPLAGLCSAHYFDQRDGLVANAWYEEGMRLLDVRDPTNIKQVGYWIPAKGETWSALFAPNDPTGSTVYSLDFVRGIEVLHIDRSSVTKKSAPVRRTWVRRAAKSSRTRTARTGWSNRGRYGYVCRIPTMRAVRAAR